MFFHAILAACVLSAAPDHWPQFHGPRRDNHSDATRLLRQWPEDGPRLLWRAQGIGHGFSSVSIVVGRIYVAGDVDDDAAITALDRDGKRLWRAKNGAAWRKSYPGSRSSPTWNDGRIYHYNANGDLACLDAADGKFLWSRSLVKEFGGRVSIWGLAESPLVDGDRVICCPAGPEIAMVALDKRTGKTIWTCRGSGDPPGYASPILAEYGGLRQVVTMTARSAIGVAAKTGKFLWRHERDAPYDVNAATPVYHDGHVAISTTWGKGTTLLRLKVQGADCAVEKAWHTAEFDNEHGGFLFLDGYLYGLADGNHRKRHWACVEWATGKTMYLADAPPGRTATLTCADGMLYLLGEQGEVALQKPSPGGLEIASRFRLPKGGEGPVWAHPVVCGGRLYIRHGEFLYAYDVLAPH